MEEPAPDWLELDAFEAALGLCLPEEYRQFLLRADGRQVQRSFVVEGTDRRLAIFYAIPGRQPMFDLVARRAALEGIVPDDLLAFARDDRGDLLCLGVHGRRLGAVYLLRITREQYPPITLRLLAPTFDTLFDDALSAGWLAAR